MAVAARCTFAMEDLRHEYPTRSCPTGKRGLACAQAGRGWCCRALSRPRAGEGARAVAHKLVTIALLGYEDRFLAVEDTVRFVRRKGILCQARGSAANSAVSTACM